MNKDKKLAALLAKLVFHKDYKNEFLSQFIEGNRRIYSIKRWSRFESYFLKETHRLSSKVPVVVESAKELNSSELHKIDLFIKDRIRNIYQLSLRINPALVAGVRIISQNQIYDISLQNELNLIKSNIK